MCIYYNKYDICGHIARAIKMLQRNHCFFRSLGWLSGWRELFNPSSAATKNLPNRCYQQPLGNSPTNSWCTLPEPNIAPEDRPFQKEVVFQPSIFRGYVSFREGSFISRFHSCSTRTLLEETGRTQIEHLPLHQPHVLLRPGQRLCVFSNIHVPLKYIM